MSIFNTNDYKQGFIDGREDGLKAKDKDYRFKGLSLKYWLNSDNAYKTYVVGYDAGYLEGTKERLTTRKVEIVPPKNETNVSKITNTENKYKTISNNNFNSTNMSLQRIEMQLDALNQLKSFIAEFERELTERMSNYNDRVYALRQAGLPEEVSDNYDKNYCMPIQTKIHQIIESMEQRDLPYISKLIADFEQAAENARLNY